MGKYENFAACQTAMTKKLGSAEKAKKYCGRLYWATHGKKEGAKKIKNEIFEIQELIKRVLNNDK